MRLPSLMLWFQLLNLFIRCRAMMFLFEDDDSVTVADAIAESDAVVPVAVSRSAWTVANSEETVVMAVSREVTWLEREAFSVVVQVTVTLVTVAASTEIRLEAGFWSTRESSLVMVETTAAQVVTAARVLLEMLLARLLAVVLAAVRPAEFWVSALALAFKLSVDSEQAEMAFRPSSSYVLHREKFPLHWLSWAIMALELSEILQALTLATAVSKVEFSQQLQASSPLFVRQVSTMPLYAVMSVLHCVTIVMFGRGKFEGLQLALMVFSHLSRVWVRLVSWLAPELLDTPLHCRSDLLPPPAFTILLRVGANRPFFPLLPPPVLFALLILASCLKKLFTLSFMTMR